MFLKRKIQDKLATFVRILGEGGLLEKLVLIGIIVSSYRKLYKFYGIIMNAVCKFYAVIRVCDVMM